MKKNIPKFKNEDKEREFWATHDSTVFINWKKAKRILLPNLRPSVKTISLRLPKSMLEELKLLANKRDVPYQSIKNFNYFFSSSFPFALSFFFSSLGFFILS
ncbi:MAG: BrnA antitoxin family protein [Nitrospinae bacterium]|nr:BrnA antitoxin family protein [Nitrospinota bacterium]